MLGNKPPQPIRTEVVSIGCSLFTRDTQGSRMGIHHTGMDMESFVFTSFLVDEGTETAVGHKLPKFGFTVANPDVPLQFLQL